MSGGEKKIARIAGDAVVALAAIVLVFALAMMLMNLKAAVVVSGSMEPAIHTGSLVMIDMDAEEVKERDIIAFRAGNMLVTHRVAEVREEGYITKGDANRDCDPGVLAKDKVEGKVVAWIPLAGGLIR